MATVIYLLGMFVTSLAFTETTLMRDVEKETPVLRGRHNVIITAAMLCIVCWPATLGVLAFSYLRRLR